MICKECKQAGKVLAMPVVSGRMVKAARLHDKCSSPADCPCQHKIIEEQ